MIYAFITGHLIIRNSKNPDEQRKSRVASYFSLAREFVGTDDSDVERVNFLKELGFSDIDALHIALAEKCGADYFVTCDDDIVKLYERHENFIKVSIISLIELVSLEVK